MADVLDTVDIPATTKPRLWIETQLDGSRRCYTLAGGCIASEDDGDLARCARFVLAIRNAMNRGAVAHIGGGFCATAKMLGPQFDHTIYEIEQKLQRFAPNRATFVPGDWTATITGTFDVIIYDLGGTTDRSVLEAYLNPGGLILGLE